MNYPEKMPSIAYFSMEFGLDEKLPIYAGGLGILAGDVLKAAYDLQLPMVGVGIFWREGYTVQTLDAKGYPRDCYEEIDTNTLTNTGVIVYVDVGGQQVPCQVWQVTAYGNVPLYLLDTNLPNSPHSWITRRLYGGSDVDRVAQEIVLGIGGVRALRKLGISVDIYHFNEGHAVLAGIELLRERLACGEPFDVALQHIKTQVVFTTHTPVLAGNESHNHHLLQNMRAYNGLNYEQMACLGGDPFCMTAAGLRMCQMANGVSTLHGVTAREMWADIEGAAPILAITNGVHTGTWQDRRIRTAYETGRDLWAAHATAKAELLSTVADITGYKLPEQALLIGFARRAAPYKRSDLILRRPDIIEPLLAAGEVSIIFSGKAHPHDDTGKEIVAHLASMARQFPDSVAFLENYNMRLAKLLVRGCDLWLNNPRRPLEASATSGMKAAMNGVPNLSTLDGWWPEACHDGVNGWQIGSGYQGPDQNERDLLSLYERLLHDILPLFRNDRERWVHIMRASIEMATTKFTAERMLLEYLNLMYLPVRAVQQAEARRLAALAPRYESDGC